MVKDALDAVFEGGIPVLKEISSLGFKVSLCVGGGIYNRKGGLVLVVSLVQGPAGLHHGFFGLLRSHSLVLFQVSKAIFAFGNLVINAVHHEVDGVAYLDGAGLYQSLGGLGLELLLLQFLNCIKGGKILLGSGIGSRGLFISQSEEIVLKFLFGLKNSLGVVDSVNLGLGHCVFEGIDPCLLLSFGLGNCNLNLGEVFLQVGLQELELYFFFVNYHFGQLHLNLQEFGAHLLGLGLGQNQGGVGFTQFGLGVGDGSLGISINYFCLCLGLVKIGNRVKLVRLCNANLRYRGRFLVLQAACEAQSPTKQHNEQRFFLHSV